MTFFAFILKFAIFIFVAFLIIILWTVTIIDNRPMEERRKQVIPDSEGEYVDFTEADDSES